MSTHCLFHDDAYITQFEAKLIDWEIQDRFIEVILDKTAFYPEGGGQPNDTGTLNGLKVLDVLWRNGNVLHVISKQYEDEIKQWELVKGKIDWKRRYDHMQHHTGQHILSRSFMEVIPEAETVSFHLTESSVNIDVAVPEIRDTELTRIQELANQVVFDDVEIKTYFTSRDAVAQKKLRKDIQDIKHEQVRIVEIGTFDIDPCGGTHTKRSGEVGIILIEDVKKAGKRGCRVRFLCGWRALKTFNQTNRLMKRVQELLKCEPLAVPEVVQSMQDANREKERSIRALQMQIQTFEIEQLIHEAESTRVKIIAKIYEDRGPEDIKRMALGIVDVHKEFVTIVGVKNDPSFIVMARSENYPELDLREILKEGLKKFKGRGGGTETLVQAGGINPEDIESLVATLESFVQQNLGLRNF